MKIALPVWQGRLSPVFDVAKKILVVDFEDGQEVARGEEELPGQVITERASKLSALKLDLLLCGAISNPMLHYINSLGINVIPFLTGDVETVLEAYISGKLNKSSFYLPGCYGRGRGRGRGRGGGGRKRDGGRGRGCGGGRNSW